MGKLGERTWKLWEDEFARMHQDDADVADIEVAEVPRDGADKIIQFGHDLNAGEAAARNHKRQESATYLRLRLDVRLLQCVDDMISQAERITQVLKRKCVLCKPGEVTPIAAQGEGDESFHQATLYGSIFPAVWNFQLALHTRGYGTCVTTLHLHREDEVRQLLGIPQTYVQGCLLPVGRLRAGHTFRPARRRPLDEVVARDRWDGPNL